MQKDLKIECFFKFMKLTVNIHMSLLNTNVFDFRALPQPFWGCYIIDRMLFPKSEVLNSEL
jgi:hypothetical protein